MKERTRKKRQIVINILLAIAFAVALYLFWRGPSGSDSFPVDRRDPAYENAQPKYR